MQYSAISARHPSLDSNTNDKYVALYRGGESFRRMVQKFLPMNPMEDKEVYSLRLQSSPYRSYVGRIVDFFAAQLFAAPFMVRSSSLEIDPYYASVKEDADGLGTDLAQLMRARFVSSLVSGWAWVLAEMPDDGGEPVDNLATHKARGLGDARVKGLDASDVIDWEVGDDGLLDWAIVYSIKLRRPSPEETRSIYTETWDVYDRENVRTYQLEYDPKRKPKDKTEVPLIKERSHRFNRVPLVRFSLPEGLHLMGRCADAQIEHFQLSCALGWALRRSAFPLGIWNLKDKDSKPSAQPGMGIAIGVDESFEWVETTGASVSVLQEEIKAQRDEIHRVASQMSNSVDNTAASIGRSGDSKMADAEASEVCLHAYGDVVKSTVEDIFELISDARGDTDVRFSIEGMSVFNLESIVSSLNNIKAAEELKIESPTLRAELSYKAADLLLPDASQVIKDKIRAEIAQAHSAAKTTTVTATQPATATPIDPQAEA